MLPRLRALGLALPLALASLAATGSADAFCGFYVAGADQKLFKNGTMVVMMREGTRTVLSMQNNYQGPPENFALVVPVPVVLQKENVKTLPRTIFDRVDQLAAPRLVEYWEQDPCAQDRLRETDAVAKYREGKQAAIGFLTGQVMKAAKGKANPKLAGTLLARELGPPGGA